MHSAALKTGLFARPSPDAERCGVRRLTLADFRSYAALDLEVEATMIALTGDNGAGKTSLLGVVAGLYRPTSGEILLDGQPITGMAPHRIARMGIGIAPQNHPIFGSLTVSETLELRPPNYRVDILSLFPNLAAKRSYRAASLSGGERQMLSMALALQADPKICILDEPSSGLAPKIVAQVFQAVKAMVDAGITVLMVEQNARAALKIADRAYVMEHGKIIASGKASDLADDDKIRRAYLGV